MTVLTAPMARACELTRSIMGMTARLNGCRMAAPPKSTACTSFRKPSRSWQSNVSMACVMPHAAYAALDMTGERE